MYLITAKKKINTEVEAVTIQAPYVARNCQAGQFIILRVDENDARIPLTIADFDREAQTITIIYQIVGSSTQLLSEKTRGDLLADVVGPLGQPVNIGNPRKILGIGGGVGIAALFPQIKKYAADGASVDAILGARSKDFVILTAEIEAFSENVYYNTDDGSLGGKGYVTDTLRALGKAVHNYDHIIAIGPLPMMKAVVAMVKPYGIPVSVSLNTLMIDGTGMCGSCRVTIGGEMKFACVDGPDFDGYLVDFGECMNRHEMYSEEEHQCRIGLRGHHND